MVKVIVFVKRNPALSRDEFHRHWREVHARLVADTPNVSRHILHYEQNPRAADDYARGETDYDGVAIACYRSRQDMEALFAEPDYLEKIRPDEERLSDATANVWIVSDDENVVVGNARG